MKDEKLRLNHPNLTVYFEGFSFSATYSLTNSLTTSLIFLPCLAHTALKVFLRDSGIKILREIILSPVMDNKCVSCVIAIHCGTLLAINR